ncbi:HTH domain-containing protein [Psychrobacillus sp. FSL W7-1493]|uniref:HTH domain-containing protein n=1 Tax=Psychrobacillus sp. FSL W7-1493 TaxID=2921552 RepID=UPI0030FCD923
MPRILILTTENSLEWVKQVETLPVEPCEYSFVVYQSLEHLKDIFLEQIRLVDGVLFSGQIPHFFVQQHFPDIDIPMLHFDVTQTDFYRSLSEYMYTNRDFQMKRCLIDFLYEENNYLGVKEWTEKEDFPYIFDATMQSYADHQVYEKMTNYHVKLWKEGKIDVSMTRLSRLPDILKPYGVNLILVVPSQRSMVEKVNELLKEIQILQLIENQVVIAHLELSITRENFRDLEYKQMSLYKAILDFSRRNNMKFIIHQNTFFYEIITNYSDFKLITNDMASCKLVSYLSTELPFIVKIGWGIGNSIQAAQLNAEKAAHLCTTIETQSYILTKEAMLIGPLGNEEHIQVDTQYDSAMEKLSAKLNTTSLQLKKIIAVMSKLQTNILSAEDLSVHLGITERAANRILKKLEEKGAAKVTTQQQKKLRGRPKKVYQLYLEDI